MTSLGELEKQQAWAALPRDERMLRARLWYASRNAQDLHNSCSLIAPSTDPRWDRAWRAKVRRSLAVYVALQQGWGGDTLQMVADLAQARDEVTRLRQRIGHVGELLEAQRRVNRLTEKLLADDGFATSDTGELPIPRPRAS